ncbi:MAG: hypothetical protein BGO78_03010 [Chloroflexi bacterium 44-23]|nr:MAG: hypothetical protein BGO78_03010 [Chloroflexi bacterium 44-23]
MCTKRFPDQSQNLFVLFYRWVLIGIQSFGGGTATFFLINQACIKYNWLTEEEFLNAWALAQLTPGINLIKLTVFIGKRRHNWSGAVMSLAGLLLPSALITLLMTAFYSQIQSMPGVKAVMHGILPATIGMALAMTIRMLSPILKIAIKEGRRRFGIQIGLLMISAIAMATELVSPVLIMLLIGAVSILLFQLTDESKPHMKVTEPG